MTAPLSRRIKWATLLLAFGLLGGYLFWPYSKDIVHLRPTELLNEAGHAYEIRNVLPNNRLWRYRSDEGTAPQSADLILFEDGRPLGPAHSLHKLIREIGRGHYSLWGQHLYFSTSDNSSPLTNGREYHFEISRHPRPIVVIVLVCLVLASAVWLSGFRLALRSAGIFVTVSAGLIALISASVNQGFVSLDTHVNFLVKDLNPASSEYAHLDTDVYQITVPAFLLPFVRIDFPGNASGVCRKAGALQLDGKSLDFQPAERFRRLESERGTPKAGWFTCSPPLVVFRVAPGATVSRDSSVSLRVTVSISDSAFVVLFATLGIGLLIWLSGRSARPALLLMRTGGTASLGIGLLLLLLNGAGETQSIRSPGIDIDNWKPGNTGFGPNDVKLNYKEARRALANYAAAEPEILAKQYLSIVSDTMGRYWNEELAEFHNIRVPPWENYLLWFFGGVTEHFRYYAFADPQKTLERGVGLCSHHALALAKLLKAQGVDARVVELFGHTVVTARVGEQEWHVLDPDFGVYLPYSLSELAARPDLVRASYASRLVDLLGPETGLLWTEDVVHFYAPEGNEIVNIDASPWYQRLEKTEHRLYQVKWAFPLVLLVLGGVLLWVGGLWARRTSETGSG